MSKRNVSDQELRNIVNTAKRTLKSGGKATVTAPKTHDPGKGRPKERLAYVSKDEEALLKRATDGKAERGPKGIPSYADDSASSKGVSRAPSSSTTSKSTTSSTTSKIGSAASAQRNSSAFSGVSSNRASGTGNSGGSAAQSAARSVSAPKAPATSKNSGPGGGSLSQPNRTAPSGTGLGTNKANNAPAANSFGPRSNLGVAGKDPSRSVSGNASSIAAQSALSNIARGSIASPAATKSITDRVPAYTPQRSVSQVVNLNQTPKEDIFSGANSFFADKDTQSVDYNKQGLGRLADQYGQYRSPPAPTTSAFDGAMGRINAAQNDGMALPAGRAFPVTQQPTPEPARPSFNEYAALRAYDSPFGPELTAAIGSPIERQLLSEAPNQIVNKAATVPSPNFLGGLRVPAARHSTETYMPGDYAAYRAGLASVNASYPYGGTTPNGVLVAESNYPENFNRIYSGADLSASPYAQANAAAPIPTPRPSDLVTRYASDTVPRPQARPADLMNQYSVSPVYGEETDAERQVREAPDPVVGPSNKVGTWIADRFANKFHTRVAPSQQDYWLGRVDRYLTDRFGKPSDKSPYAQMMRRMNDVAGSGHGPEPYTPKPPTPPAAPQQPVVEAGPVLPPLPPYVNYQNGPQPYYGTVAPSPLVTNYINSGYRKGGAVGTTLDAVMRMLRRN